MDLPSRAQVIVTHERRGEWARRLRLRFADVPVRWAETRSRADLRAALRGVVHPIVVLDLTGGQREALEALADLDGLAEGALTLALDPSGSADLAALARELGATHVSSGLTTPPEVEAILRGWLRLAAERTERAGWSGDPPEVSGLACLEGFP